MKNNLNVNNKACQRKRNEYNFARMYNMHVVSEHEKCFDLVLRKSKDAYNFYCGA
jgi:hypothetical protein